MLPRAVLRAAAFTGFITLVTATPALAAGSASASAARPSVVTCPTVSSTGVVTPAPAPGIDWSGCDLGRAQLTGANLTGANLTGAELAKANLTGANLTQVNLTGADLIQSTMTGANLTSATLTGDFLALAGVTSGGIVGTPASLPAQCILGNGFLIGDDANLAGADLSGLDLSGSFIPNVDLTGADLTGTDLSNASMASSVLTDATLSGASLTGATLERVISGGVIGQPSSLPGDWTLSGGFLLGPQDNLQQADLRGVDLSGADLQDADIVDADLGTAQLRGTSLVTANLDGAVLTGADATGADFTKASLAGTTLQGTDLASATLTGALSGNITGQPSAFPDGWTLAGGFLIGPGTELDGADLHGLDLSGAHLQNADLSFANLTGSSLSNADLTDADLQGADLTNATLTGAVVNGANWDGTICPDGMTAIKHEAENCVSPLDTTPPAAHPAASGTAGQHGWFTSPTVAVGWNWTDSGTINPMACTLSSTASGNGVHTLTASCLDQAGNQGAASDQIKIDTTAPVASVTGVRTNQIYRLGSVPAAHCNSSDHVSGIQTPARLKITTTGSHGVGDFSATCSGAISVAGQHQANPGQAFYTVLYGLRGFGTPRPGTTIPRSQHTIAVAFQLANAAGRALTGSLARQLAARHHVQVRLTGPGITGRNATCTWADRTARFTCSLRIPAGVHVQAAYHLTARENVDGEFFRAPGTSRDRNPEVIRFK